MDVKLIQQSYEVYKESVAHSLYLKQADIKFTETAKKLWIGKDVARLPSVYFFNRYVKDLNITSNNLLTFGGLEDIEVKVLPRNNWVDKDFWKDQKDDVEDLSLSDLKCDFDFIMINQTFEHLIDIQAAIINIKRLLKSGGYFYANFPVINIPHGHPFNFFTGVSVQYIIYLCLKHNLNITRCGQWGNVDYINYIYRNLTWPDYTQINLDNDASRPCIGWVLAQKL